MLSHSTIHRLLLTSTGRENDVENALREDDSPLESDEAPEATLRSKWRALERTLLRYNLEARGIQRVSPEHRHDMKQSGFMQIAILWISINLCANNLTLGLLSVQASSAHHN